MVDRLLAALAAAAVLLTQALAQVSGFSDYSGEAGPVDNARWAAFLDAYVSADETGVALVDYDGVSEADAAALASYLDDLQALDPTRLARDEAFAYWVNLYNALTVKLILDEYPVRSIREIKSGLFSIGPWGRELAEVNGAALSLNEIEHEILRAFWDEPRVHYAVNCASMGCPNLMDRPWTGETLEADLDAAARAFINHPRGVSAQGGRVTASSIFKWYAKDFGANEAEVLDHVRRFADDDLKAALKGETAIDTYAYDWSLNEAPK